MVFSRHLLNPAKMHSIDGLTQVVYERERERGRESRITGDDDNCREQS